MTILFDRLVLRYILTGILFLLIHDASSQQQPETQSVELAFNKTSTIVFAAPITAVDRGSRDVLAQKAKGVTNVLQLKAARTNFKETNLTVITADGILHHFLVRYAEMPAIMTFDRRTLSASHSRAGALIFQNGINEASLQQHAEYILAHPPRSQLKATSRYKMKLALLGIYIHENIMFYQVRITNTSNISYDTDMLRFFVRDKQQVKRTAAQEVGERPLYIAGNPDVIPANTSIDVVYALPKFTIPDAKCLGIELLEKKGGRHLCLQVNNKTIMKAQPIP